VEEAPKINARSGGDAQNPAGTWDPAPPGETPKCKAESGGGAEKNDRDQREGASALAWMIA